MSTHPNRIDLSGSGDCIPAAAVENAAPDGCKDTGSRLEDLRSLYRSTFEEWASQVGHLDAIRDSACEGDGLRETQERTTAAEARYRKVRNRLVQEMTFGNEDRRA